MAWYETSVIIIYFLALGYLFLYSLGQLHLTIQYIKAAKNIAEEKAPITSLPLVTVQLPIYNEQYVVERLIDAVANLDYPLDLLEIQILDDSTDETSSIIQHKIKPLIDRGLDIQYIKRKDRVGFKAGALAFGLKLAKGEFIAIFDADFIPQKGFLKSTAPYFTDYRIGMVQTRWGHINRNHSLLTKLQAFGLDAHFSVEQTGRNSVASFINFNGTAGIWRKACIEDAGGWSADTLTEDLDLSYRAQIKGWKFKYLESVESPAELPILMPAIKTQQYRWNKGAAETSKKNLIRVYRQHLPFITKIHATFHLLNSSVFLMLLIVGILSFPLLYIKSIHPEYGWIFKLANVFLIGFFSIVFYFWIASKKAPFTRIKESFIATFIPFMTFSMGLSLHNGLAVLEGFMGRKTPFIRTPKFNATDSSDGAAANKYISRKVDLMTIIELLFGLYFMAAIALGLYLKDYGMILFHAMLAVGFISVFYQSFKMIWHGK